MPAGFMQTLAGIISIPPVTFEDLVLAESPYAYYNFQQSWSAGLLDQSGNGRNLSASSGGPSVGPAARSTVSQCAWWGTTGIGAPATRVGSSYYFNDTTNVLEPLLTTNPADANQTRITLMFSFMPETIMGNFAKIIGWRDNSSGSRLVVHTQYPSGTNIATEVRSAINHSTSPAYRYLVHPTFTVDGNWAIVTITYDGSTDIANYYINGSLVDTDTNGTYNSIYTTGNKFEFMGNLSGGGNGYGRTDALALWNRVLDQTTIEEMQDVYVAELV